MKPIFLSRVFQIESYEIPENSNISSIAVSIKDIAMNSQQQLQSKNRGNDNHCNITNLHELRVSKGLTIADICKKTGLSYDNYIKYEKGYVKLQYMSINTLQKLSVIFETNLLSNYHIFKMNASKEIKAYMNIHKLSIRHCAKHFKVSTTTVKNWLKGVCSPSYNTWEKYFK